MPGCTQLLEPRAQPPSPQLRKHWWGLPGKSVPEQDGLRAPSPGLPTSLPMASFREGSVSPPQPQSRPALEWEAEPT